MRIFLGITWLIVLGFAMLTPGDRLPEINAFDFQDKVIHTICFLILSFIWAGVSKNHLKKDKKSINWLIFIFLAILPSIAFEIGQLWIPNRSFDWWDLGFNQLGIWLGFFGYFKI